MVRGRLFVGTVAALALVTTAGAQGPPPAVRSPEVHADRPVTLRLRAPLATSVELLGEVLRGTGPQAMTKGADGVGSVTVVPLPPEIWIYNFDLPDSANHPTYTESGEAIRQAVNQWIRASGAYDAVLDFDQVVRDSADPKRLRREYDPGDHVHPNDAGNAAMAAAIDVSAFR